MSKLFIRLNADKIIYLINRPCNGSCYNTIENLCRYFINVVNCAIIGNIYPAPCWESSDQDAIIVIMYNKDLSNLFIDNKFKMSSIVWVFIKLISLKIYYKSCQFILQICNHCVEILILMRWKFVHNRSIIMINN